MTEGQPDRVTLFLDANILISAEWKDQAEVAQIWHLENVRLITSAYVMTEVARNLPQIERLRGLMTTVQVLRLAIATEDELKIVELAELPIKTGLCPKRPFREAQITSSRATNGISANGSAKP